jgi:hypothetical protein
MGARCTTPWLAAHPSYATSGDPGTMPAALYNANTAESKGFEFESSGFAYADASGSETA